MKLLKTTFILISLFYLLNACGSAIQNTDKIVKEEPVLIANDSLAYEIIIFDIGFTAYLAGVAQQRKYNMSLGGGFRTGQIN